jgi:site-specific recombinase XerD
LNFRVKFKLDRRGTKNPNGTFDKNAICPIKVNLHSKELNRNYDFSIKDVVFEDGSIIKLEATTTDFDSIWVNKDKKDSFGTITGETTVYGRKAEIRNILKIKQDILKDIISRKGITNYRQVKELFYKYKKSRKFVDDVYGAFNLYIEKLEIRGSIKSAKSLSSSRRNLFRFLNPDKTKEQILECDGKPLRFSDITIDFLDEYERKRLAEVSKSTVGVDLRNVRTVFNYAISQNESLQKFYPFGRGKYQIPTGGSKNAAITKEQLRKIKDFSSDNYYLQMARDYFMFSYYANGMNLKDIAKLKTGQTEWIRSKTEFTLKEEKRLDIEFNDVMLDIIERHKGRGKMLFDILEENDDAATITRKVDNKVQSITHQIKNLAEILDLPEKLSFQWARHSYTTNVYRADVNFKAISETLGHNSLKTTENYIDSLIDENKKAINDAKEL